MTGESEMRFTRPRVQDPAAVLAVDPVSHVAFLQYAAP
jgi:hypothetical protein